MITVLRPGFGPADAGLSTLQEVRFQRVLGIQLGPLVANENPGLCPTSGRSPDYQIQDATRKSSPQFSNVVRETTFQESGDQDERVLFANGRIKCEIFDSILDLGPGWTVDFLADHAGERSRVISIRPVFAFGLSADAAGGLGLH
jgi:hypothetical protein